MNQNNVDIRGGKINGTTIGSDKPDDGSFINLISNTAVINELVGDKGRFKRLWADKTIYRILDNVKLNGSTICEDLTLVKYLETYEVSDDNKYAYFKPDDFVFFDGKVYILKDLTLLRPKYITKVELLIFKPDGYSFGSKFPLVTQYFNRKKIEHELANNGPICSKAKYILLSSNNHAFIYLGEPGIKTIIGYGITGSVIIEDLKITLYNGDTIKVLHDGYKWILINYFKS